MDHTRIVDATEWTRDAGRTDGQRQATTIHEGYNWPQVKMIESTKTTSMEDISIGVLGKKKNI